MKKVSKFIVILSMIIMLSACDNKNETLSENIKKLELTGNLVTYEAYFHNVLKLRKILIQYLKKIENYLLNTLEQLGLELTYLK